MSRFISVDDKMTFHLNCLRQKRLWELENKPGFIKCENLAESIQQGIENMSQQYEDLIYEQQKAVDKEVFDTLYVTLCNLITETRELAKKNINAILNTFKIENINHILVDLKEILKNEPSAKYLVVISVNHDENQRMPAQNNSYSDVVLILSQYKSACDVYKNKYYGRGR